MSATQKTPELRPEIVFIFDLVTRVVEGRIKIPRFQRPFVWKRHQMIDLLDSMTRQYPIGSLLAWETEAEIVSLHSIGPITLQPHEGKGTPLYVLDGHQRLTTIAGALVSAGNRDTVASPGDDPGQWDIAYNAYEEVFEHFDAQLDLKPFQFPTSKMLDTFDFLNESRRVVESDPDNGQLYLKRIQAVARGLQTYRIPVIQIRETGLTEAVEIFARLNSKGQSMTADQMVSALLYREGESDAFDLAAEISECVRMLEARGFGGIDRTLILRSLLAAIGEDIYRTDWTRIAKNRRDDLLERLRAAAPAVKASLLEAVEFFNREVGVFTDRLLPYAMQMTVVSSFFFAEPNPSSQQVDLMKRWFWVTSFATWFGGANPSRVNALVRDVMDKVANERAHPVFSTFDLETPAVALPRSFDMRSARTRVSLLVQFSLQPRDQAGAVVKDPDILVRLHGPEALGYVASNVSDPELRRSPANRLLRDPRVHRGQARGWLVNLSPAVFDEVWRSNAMPVESKEDLAPGCDATSFLAARLALLQSLEFAFMDARQVTRPLSDAPSVSPADADERFEEPEEFAVV